MSTWIADYIDAWNSHDGNKVTSFMADDVVYEDLALGQVHEGRPQLRPSYREAMNSPRTTRSSQSANRAAAIATPLNGR